ncbi:hypothetical protein K469DRAFT_713151 [Zopfia rhizophila CBS 207.26]|uniref:Heterokaryon incompatibility domain-containing protein n=1 Tax=Zopfia rhizophila CBS 207.26 TaxID=1314779 RepID=A0A6A6DUK6_9PEZI|nr:hypothetical protein K469DRAFT_713151 [Zopfia rhizophila CBS 207.26]
MEDHAKRLSHLFLLYGLSAWNSRYFGEDYSQADKVWGYMKRMAKSDMRLMYLDNEFHSRIGWAARAARLHDEVFLLPGCSIPVILCRRDEGRYQFVGDTIVIGAMENEVWKKTGAEDLTLVEIV